MANRYADSRNGNDSNDGLSWANAKKTLSASITAASSGDTIFACGVFNESYTEPNKNLTFTAQGFAILDGQSALSVAVTPDGNNVSRTYNSFILRNYTSTLFNGNPGAGSTASHTFNDCRFEATPTGIVQDAGGESANRCIFSDCSTVGYSSTTTYGSSRTFTGCTFVGCGTGIKYTGNVSSISPTNCIFRSNTTHIEIVNSTIYNTASNYNCIDFSSGNCKIGASTYTTMADWRTAVGSPKDSASISKDPLFADQAKGVYMLKSDSPCLVNGGLAFGSLIQGAWINPAGVKGSDCWSTNRNAAVWNGATLTNTEIDGSNNIVLSAGQTSGTAVFLHDFGAQTNIRRIDLSHIYGWSTSVLDYDLTDTKPETWEFRYRTSGDATPPAGAWTEASWLSDLNLSGVRQLEIEVTLTKNGS